MKVLFFLLIVATSLPATVLQSSILVDLPELTGIYSLGGDQPPVGPSSRTTTFVLPEEIESIEGLRFLASGPWNPAQVETCIIIEGVSYCDTFPWGIGLTLRLTAEPLGDCQFQATVSAYGYVNGDEPLDGFCPEGQPDFNLLLGSEITAELFCDFPQVENRRIIEAAWGVLLEVQIETVGAVPVRQSSWGDVKSLFR